jgi:Flp pilus assembly protein TadG
MMHRLRNESGQALVVFVLFAFLLLGAVALSLDVGSWFREHRQAQTTADAAVLSAAQLLPAVDTTSAEAAARDYAVKNGSTTAGVDSVTFNGKNGAFDTVTVRVTRQAPGFFSKLFSIDSTFVHATATARSEIPYSARWAAPITVNRLHPMISGIDVATNKQCPCFGPDYVTTLPLGKTGAPGAFALINLDLSDQNGTIGASTLGDWILHGFDAYLEPGEFFSDPGAKWNDNPIQDAIHLSFDTDLLFPVYDTIVGTGSNAEYHVIGWVGFHLLSDVVASGTSGSITGYFTHMTVDGIQSSKQPPPFLPDFGVRSISLIH